MKNFLQQLPAEPKYQDEKRFSSTAVSAFKLAIPIVLITGILVFFLPGVQGRLGRIHEVSSYLTGLGWAAPLVFIPAVAVLVAVGMPRLFLCPIGGMAFGFWQGLLWSQIGTMLGFYATFLFVRWSGSELILQRWPRLNRYTGFFRKNGIISVLLIRQLPVTGFYTNLLCGIMPLTHADFLLGTVLGILPAAVPATLVGTGITAFSSGESKIYTLLAIAAGIALWAFACRFTGAFLKKKKAEDAHCNP